jgi:uncharacterized protein YjiS (DUF1127 family)
MTISPAILASIELSDAMQAPRQSFLGRVISGLAARRNRDDLAKIYHELLLADDHILRDLGVTRHDVMRMRASLFAK